MKYEGWPELRQKCLLCGRPGCAIYRGYYTRYLFCPEMEFLGLITIRTAYCKRLDERFTLLPDFVIRYRRISRLSLLRFHECYRDSCWQIMSAIDAFTEGLGEEFCIALSSAYAYVALKIAVPP